MKIIRHVSVHILWLCLLLPSSIVLSQVGEIPGIPTNPEGGNLSGSATLLSTREFTLAIALLVFGLILIVIQTYLLKGAVNQKTDEVVRTYLVTLIIIGTLVLIAAGFSSEQIAPALGLFGTIAGYLLGRAEKAQTGEEEKPKS